VNPPAPTTPTYVACLTPPGTGAIATLALRGPRAWLAVRDLLTPASPKGKPLPDEPELGKFWLGRLGERTGGGLADEVVVALKQTSPVPWVEVHCHGGREVIRFLLEVFEAQGLRACSWQDLERRTTHHPGRALALAALAEARTVRTAAILLDQYHGAFGRAVEQVQAALRCGRQAEAEAGLRELTRYTALGKHLTTPWRVVVAGAPNVGKSSLVNALAGYQRSVVAPTPGTTRDVVTTVIAVDGWPVELADTAGLRPEAGELEQCGIDRAQAAAEQADLCLWVLDGSAPPVWPALASPVVRYVVNKVDLPAAASFPAPDGAVRVSARTGAGLDGLLQALVSWLVPDPPAPGVAVPFNPALCDRVEQALRFATEGRAGEALAALNALYE
jgi:tRNA modification GTPase